MSPHFPPKELFEKYDASRIFLPVNLLQMLFVHVVGIGVLFYDMNIWLIVTSILLGMIFDYAMGIFHHMQLTHESFDSPIWVTRLGALLGTLTWRGPMAPPLKYTAIHHVHHQYSDTPADPHTPTEGIAYAFMGWFWNYPKSLHSWIDYEKFVTPKYRNDPYLRLFDQHPHLIQGIWAALSFLAGIVLYSGNAIEGGLVYVAYLVCFRGIVSVWLANAVDVINHTVGYRNYNTPDHSTNSFIMAAVHLGGAISWHNNHHAEPGYFTVRKKWWEFDVHHLFLKMLSLVGLTSNIKKIEM